MEQRKQTAVEWFAVNAIGLQIALREKYISLSPFGDKYNEYLEQAKQMEKEQIKNACEEGFMWSAEGWNGEMLEYYKDGNETLELHKEEYYNETYANDTTKGLPEEDSKRRAWHY